MVAEVAVTLQRAIVSSILGTICISVGCGGGSTEVPVTREARTSATPDGVAAGGVFLELVDSSVPPVRLAGGDGQEYFGPSWSPNSTLIAVSRGSDLVLLDVAREPRVLLRNGRSNYLPAWSPDGSALVYVSQEGSDTSTAELFRIGADGTVEQRLTHDVSWDYGAAWLSDEVIVFGSQRDGTWRIYTMDLRDGAVAPLAFDATGNAPAVSRDGRRIAFTSDRDGDDDIYVMAADGSNQTNLTMNEHHDDNAAWSPDGSLIAFSSDRSGKNEIYVMNADGSDVRQLTDDASLIPNIPSWAPQGTGVVFAAAPVTESD